MVVAIDAPGIAERLVDIGFASVVGVLQAGHLAALDGIEVAVLRVVGQAHHFMHACRPEGVLEMSGRVFVGTFDDVNVALAGGDGEFVVGQELHPAAFEGDILGDGQRDDFVVFRFCRRLGRLFSGLAAAVERRTVRLPAMQLRRLGIMMSRFWSDGNSSAFPLLITRSPLAGRLLEPALIAPAALIRIAPRSSSGRLSIELPAHLNTDCGRSVREIDREQ